MVGEESFIRNDQYPIIRTHVATVVEGKPVDLVTRTYHYGVVEGRRKGRTRNREEGKGTEALSYYIQREKGRKEGGIVKNRSTHHKARKYRETQFLMYK